MTTKLFGKRLLKIGGILLGVVLALLIGFHFWFKAHALDMIEDLVESRSNGKLKLKADKFSFNWFTRKMTFQNAVFYSTDSATASSAYRFSVEEIKLEVQAILPIVFNKRILIDTMTLLQPEIQVTRLRSVDKKPDRDISLPEEMGNVYNSIQDALKVLRVSRFLIDNGTFVLINKIQPEQQPIRIGNLRFLVENLQIDTTIRGSREKILFSDNVTLQSHDQDIMFPDGRHRLSFGKFRINLQERLVEFDSCTIAATRKDSSVASFSIFLDALKLIDIDFDTLYKHEVIKADSVYCVNPRFNLEVELGIKKGKGPPKLENIIKQLTGDLQLGFVVVNNADFHIRSIKDGVPNTFSSTGNNFEMQGLSIDQQLAKPLKVRSFAMAIRNYENFLKDSTYSVQFDSVLFRDDRIYLSNFLFQKLNNGKVINSFKIPQFYLGGLSWDDLVFEKKLKAEQATLFNPHIRYTVSEKFKNKGGEQNLFQSLGAVNDFMDIEYLDIVDGNIDLVVNKNLRVRLDEATLAIQSHDLLTSTRIAGIKNSVSLLDFRTGVIQAGDLEIRLSDIRYLGNTGKFSADKIAVTGNDDRINILLNTVAMEKLRVDEQNGNIFSEDIQWAKGTVRIRSQGSGTDRQPLILLDRVKGRDTDLDLLFGQTHIDARLDNISFDHLIKKPGEKITIHALQTKGAGLRISSPGQQLSVSQFHIHDLQSAALKNLHWKNDGSHDHVDISVPSINFRPDIQSVIAGKYLLGELSMEKPVFQIQLNSNGKQRSTLPDISIDKLTLTQPEVHFEQNRSIGRSRFSWKPATTDHLEMQSIRIGENGNDLVSIQKLGFQVTGLNYTSASGSRIMMDRSVIAAEAKDIRLSRKADGNWDGAAYVSQVNASDIVLDSLGKKNGKVYLESTRVSDLALTTAAVTNIRALSAANAAFFMQNSNGYYSDADTKWEWRNLRFDRRKKVLSIDSIMHHPHLDLKSFLEKQMYQDDYLVLRLQQLQLTDPDLDAFLRDKTVKGNTLSVGRAYLSDYRDNTKTFRGGVIKPLPVALVRKIPFPLAISTVKIENASVDFTQVSEITKTEATIPIRDLRFEIDNFRNEETGREDSLSLRASGYVLDAATFYLQMKQSYEDTAGGFLLNAQFSGVDLERMNPVMIPLASVRLRNGRMDTAFLSVTGKEYYATGEMKMDYKNLKIDILQGGDTTARRKGLLNFLANTFVIRNKTTPRNGLIFLYRDRERSMLNYLVKIAMTGFASSVGVKTARKEFRKFEKDRKKKSY